MVDIKIELIVDDDDGEEVGLTLCDGRVDASCEPGLSGVSKGNQTIEAVAVNRKKVARGLVAAKNNTSAISSYNGDIDLNSKIRQCQGLGATIVQTGDLGDQSMVSAFAKSAMASAIALYLPIVARAIIPQRVIDDQRSMLGRIGQVCGCDGRQRLLVDGECSEGQHSDKKAQE